MSFRELSAIGCDVSNGGEVLKIGEYLTMLLYHGWNQKAMPFDSAPSAIPRLRVQVAFGANEQGVI